MAHIRESRLDSGRGFQAGADTSRPESILKRAANRGEAGAAVERTWHI